jgi:hypothetical protein
MFPTTATIRAAKRDRVAGGQQQLPTGKVVSDCYTCMHSLTLVMVWTEKELHQNLFMFKVTVKTWE